MIPLYNEQILYKSRLYSFKKDLSFDRCFYCPFYQIDCKIMNTDSWFCCNAIISGKYATIN